ncbi:MAG: protein kinase [Myxococcales bacterium]|nr:protein kinase [Myxococcales bacterium]
MTLPCTSRTLRPFVVQYVEKDLGSSGEGAPLPKGIAVRFQVRANLGSGASSQVFEAIERQSGALGVLKVLAPEAFQPSELQRIKREWGKQANLAANGRLLVPLCSGEAEGALWLFRPLIDGIPLSVILQDGPLGVGDAIAVAYETALALDQLHGEGLLHRDIKPEHILIAQTKAGIPVISLIDAGVAGRVDRRGLRPLFGTPGYLSPEQIQGKLASFRSDLYALGCVFYEMVTGHPLFQRDSLEELLQAHATAPRPALPAPLPNSVRRILGKCLAIDPQERPISAQQLCNVLSPFYGGHDEQEEAVVSKSDPNMGANKDAFSKSTLLGIPTGPSRPGVRPTPPKDDTGLYQVHLTPSGPAVVPVIPKAAAPKTPRINSRGNSLITEADLEEADASALEPIGTATPAVNAPGYSSVAPPVPYHALTLEVDDFADTDAKIAIPALPDSEEVTSLPPRKPVTAAPALPIPTPTRRDATEELELDSVVVQDVDFEEIALAPRSLDPRLSLEPTLDDGDTDRRGFGPFILAFVAGTIVTVAIVGIGGYLLFKDRLVPSDTVATALPPSSTAAPVAVVEKDNATPVAEEPVPTAADLGAENEIAAAQEEAIEAALEATPTETETETEAESATASAAEPTEPVATPRRGRSRSSRRASSPKTVAAPRPATPEKTAVAKAEPAPAVTPPSEPIPEPVAEPKKAAVEPEAEKGEASPFDQLRDQAKALYGARRFREAAAAYERATTMNPSHAGSFSGLGASRLAGGDTRGAIAAFQKAASLAPRHSGYMAALGTAYKAAGDRTNAARAYERALELNPNNAAARKGLASLGLQ